ncbi:type IV toxin-antitoxin system AbiEi family antitoxin domain-containing protein [Paenibacillus oceani]|uniref:AbiEi antitoxin C-terminal domain-containing protein n=1 Tax=Paenibacillus oceani TaxID=2772510 RepID=A0A927CAV4_9BACL|nr:hypothetical protein [Paenibacillus oceani]MBD2864643.1 hypothetical protein [Paenibacillus oceani]
MGRLNRYQIMELYQEDIVAALNEPGKKVLNFAEINGVLMTYEKEWRLPKTTTPSEFLEFLVNQKKILKEVYIADNYRYVFRNQKVTPTELALSLYPKVYLSHYSAVYFHDLTNENVKSIYINKEQSDKGRRTSLSTGLIQENIDNAFSKPMRKTNNFFDYEGQRIYVINGGYTDNLGVKKINGLAVTDLERTLIDIAVRPDYSGGVYEVLSIYERAKGKISANKLRMYLKNLKYVYPYHQAIGFYMECAGFSETALKIMESFPMFNDFYLTYNIPDREYSKRWRLYYPKNFSI